MNAKQLLQLATLCSIDAEILLDQTDNEYVRCGGNGYCVYEPVKNDAQCFTLLMVLMMIDNWQLFADEDVNEFYIYQWDDSEDGKHIISAGRNLNEVILEAAEEYLDELNS